ncbi:hypothetical protein Hanom_Chr14g01313121 [Helianthus anomalus]
MVATLSARLFSKGNWNAMVKTDLMLSDGPLFVDWPTSRLEVKSRVRWVVPIASFGSPWSEDVLVNKKSRKL